MHGAERVDVALEAGIVRGSGLRGGELLADVAGQVLRRRHQPAAGGIIEDQVAEGAAGIGFARPSSWAT